MKSIHSNGVVLFALVAVLPLTMAPLGAQARGTAELSSLVSGLTVTPRVLVIGMHPDDEDSQLLAWLTLGRHVQTAYLSITRGESAGNFLGPASGITLGAARTQETLAARRIDGAEQFFTQMYDFGFARSDSELFARWNRDSLLGDIVKTVRSFRPHVIVVNTPTDTADHDTQHRALESLARDAFGAAAEGKRFHALDFGDPWTTAKLYRRGPGLAIDAGEFNAELGVTYAAVAREARESYRTQGLLDLMSPRSSVVALERVDSVGVREASIFDGVDTSLSRVTPGLPTTVATALAAVNSSADTARSRTVEGLARFAGAVAQARIASPSCRHPVAVLSMESPKAFGCYQGLLDLDASLNLIGLRANAALLIAAGVTIDATADRELVATSDTALVTIQVANHGVFEVRVEQVSVWGDVDTTKSAVIVPAGGRASIVRRAAGLSQRYQWWMGPRAANRYAVPVSSIDGVSREPRVQMDTLRADPAAMRANGVITMMMTAGVAIPEHLRRTSDATITLTVAGATITTSLGPVVFRYADAIVGMQDRPLAGVPDVTLNLNRALSFVAADTKLDRGVHVNVASRSGKWQSLSLRVVTPPGVSDSTNPRAFRMAPRDQRDVTVQLRGSMTAGEKQQFGVIGQVAGQSPLVIGFRTTQYPELLPIRVSWQSGMWLQPVAVTVPRTLTTVYVPGVSDESYLALQDVGVSVAVIPPADLLSVDLRRVTTVVLGPRVFEAHPELLQQVPRLMNWARGGGTVVVLRGGPVTLKSGALPHFVDLGNPPTQRISDPAAPVTRLTAAPTLLQWPNIISPDDWKGWTGERAPYAPTQVDPAYQRVIETHNPGDKVNANAILSVRVGKGLFIYSALTLDEQIAAGNPGALRILVNLVSAGITPPGAR